VTLARLAVVAALVGGAAGLGCWWNLRSAPTSVRDATPAPANPETARGADDPTHPWRVAVHVVRADDKTPISGAEVVCEGGAADTDASGVARFARLSGPKNVVVVVHADGFVRDVAGFFAPIEVKADETRDVLVEMRRAAAMEGIVRDADGTPFSGARLFVDGAQMHFAVEPNVAEATSGADGRFRLDGLPVVGATRIRCRAVRRLPTSIAWSASDASPVEIRLSKGARIRGVVRDATGAFVPGALVRAWSTDPGKTAIDEIPSDPHANADDDGRYEIDVLPLGVAWSVVATKTGFADAERADGIVPDAAHLECVRDFALRELAWIDLTVTEAGGRPVKTADLTVETSAGRYTLRNERTHPSDAIEIASFPHVTLGVEARGFAPTSMDLDVAPGERRAVEIRLDADAAIAGVVVDDRGVPVPLVDVTTTSNPRWKFGRVERAAASQTDGAFRVAGLVPGAHVLNAYRPGFEQVLGLAVAAPASDVRIVLRRRSTLSITVRAPSGAKKPAQFTVATRRSGSYERELRDFDWTDGPHAVEVDPGEWRVEVKSDGFAQAESGVDVAPGETKALDVEMKR